MNPVATSDAAFRGGACPTPEYTIAYTGNYTTSADANERGQRRVDLLELFVLARAMNMDPTQLYAAVTKDIPPDIKL